MSEVTHYSEHSATSQDTLGTTFEEVTAWTVDWTDLTTAGFANGDVVNIIVQFNLGGQDTSTIFSAEVRKGSTFSGAAVLATQVTEPRFASQTNGYPALYLDELTLSTNDNLYISMKTGNGGVRVRIDDFSVLLIKKSDLTANDILYDEQTHSGNESTSYDTNGASVTIPKAGNWVIWGQSEWLIDSVSSGDLAIHALQVAGSDVAEIDHEGEDTAEEWLLGNMHYAASLSVSDVCRVRTKVGCVSTHDVARTAILALRLGAFKDSAGVRTVSDITHSVLDTFQEFAGFSSYSASQTGDVLVAAFTKSVASNISCTPYTRIQLADADWPVTAMFNKTSSVNNTTEKIPNAMMAVASIASGSHNWDFDIAEATDVSPTYDTTEYSAVVLSLELAVSGVNIIVPVA